LIEGTGRSDVLVGRDDDNQADTEIQAGATANQSLDNADPIVGGRGDDILIGMLGSDVLLGGPGDDVMIGGIEGGSRPNQDIQIGDTGNDIAVWQGGDGSDLFDGGPGPRDTLVFGTIDRDANNVPVISPVDGRHAETGLPTANVSGQGGFCRLPAGAAPAAPRAAFRCAGCFRAAGAPPLPSGGRRGASPVRAARPARVWPRCPPPVACGPLHGYTSAPRPMSTPT